MIEPIGAWAGTHGAGNGQPNIGEISDMHRSFLTVSAAISICMGATATSACTHADRSTPTTAPAPAPAATFGVASGLDQSTRVVSTIQVTQLDGTVALPSRVVVPPSTQSRPRRARTVFDEQLLWHLGDEDATQGQISLSPTPPPQATKPSDEAKANSNANANANTKKAVTREPTFPPRNPPASLEISVPAAGPKAPDQKN